MTEGTQGCPGEPFPRAGIEACPSKQALPGASISSTRGGGRAGSQECSPGASRLCLVYVATAGRRGQQPCGRTLTTYLRPTQRHC